MKARFLALMALVLGMVSCQNDFDEANNLGKGEVDFTLNVAVPEMTTRAAGAGSEKSGLENVDLSKYDIRYILEVYDKNGDLAKERMTNYTDEDQTAFNLRLVPGRQYTFVVWADFVDQIAGDRVEGKNYDKHYITADGLKKVTVNEASWTAIDESRDAYTGKHTETEFKGTSNITVELKRPFAKLRVVTTDIKELYGDLMPKTVKVNYISTYFYNEFNALTQDVNNSTVAPVAAPEMTVDLTKMTYTNEAPKSNGKMTLFADYFFRATDDRVMFTMDIVDSNDEAIPQVVFNTNIPVERNYLTTVLGPILTDSNNINVTINDAFTNGTEWNPDSDDYDVEMISGTKTETMILESGTYLFDDVIIKAAGDAIVVKGDVVIDVMGSLTLDSKGGIVVENGGSLVINGVVETRAAERAGRLVVETEEGSAIAGQNITIQNLAGLTAKANGKHAFGIGAAEAEVTIVNTKIDYVCGGYVQPLFVNDAKYGKSEPEGGAAIGGAKVTIIDSEIVKAEGGSKAAAIGNKFWAGTEIVIKNSTLGDIFGGNASAAIGGSRYDGENKHNISIEIENSTITNAVGGQAGAGIGSGYDTHCNQQNYEATNNIVIKNSTIKAKGGKNAAGIGTGYHSAYLTGSIDAASTIEATRGDEPFYKNTYTVSQNIGYGIVDPAREFSGANAEVTFTVAGKVIATPAIEVNDAASLAAALMADRKNISVVLTADIELPISSLGQITGGSGEYKLGAENTETITIDLGGKKLNITTTYWSNLGAKNNDALFTIKNGTMTSSQASGTWNSYDLTFSNCDYVFEDVEFAKAVAFDNAGKNVTMNNVTINETHDYYAMWITATGQTVNIDGLTVESAGRGIKIDEQYVGDSVAKVTLNVKNAKFTTAKKAAIMVKSAAGADITLSNIDIAGVKEDSSNEVWVDEDAAQYVDKVNVVGGSMIVEGQSIVPITNMETLKTELTKAGEAGAGYTVLEISADIDMTGEEWTPIKVDGYHGADIVTIDGKGHTITGLTASLFAGGFAGGSGIVIKNLTIADSKMVANNTQGYGAFVNCADSMDVITLINCHLKNSSIITPNNGADESRIGGLVGWTAGYGNENDGPVDSYITIENCSVTGCTLKGFGSVGAICGHAGANKATFTTIKNCTVTNNKLISTDDGGWRVGVVVGTANNGQCKISNITENGNTLEQKNANNFKNPTGATRHYFGRFVPAGTGTLVIDDVTIEAGKTVIAEGVYKTDADNKFYQVESAKGLVYMAENGLKAGDGVKLAANIDLAGVEFAGLNTFHPENNNTFDGQGYTVSNWTYEGGASDMAFIRNWVGPIKNIKFENCYVKSSGRSAIVAAKVYGDIENVTVDNCTIEDSYWACGIIAGLYNAGSIKNCTVTNSYIKSNGGTGGIVGVINETAGERVIEGCSVSNTTINNTGVYGASYSGGALVGLFNADNATYRIKGCSVSNNTLEGSYVYEKYPADENVIEE